MSGPRHLLSWRPPWLLALLVACAVALLPGTAPPQAIQAGAPAIAFDRGVVGGFTAWNPTALAWGPDGRLYVAQLNGAIYALTIDPSSRTATAVETVTTSARLRDVLGIAFSPLDPPAPPTLYVSDQVINQGSAGDPFTGKIVRLSGPAFATATEIITGIPMSFGFHGLNNIVFDGSGRLYLPVGGTTNAGVPNSSGWDETPLSGAILVADIYAPGFDGRITYDGTAATSTVNQTGGDVAVFAAGFRNPYDLVLHSNGKIYGTDNGPDPSFVGGASTSCTTAGPQADAPDELNLIQPGRYYGHANRNRGRFDPRQCVYHSGVEGSGPGWTGPLAPLGPSSDGIIEYTAPTLGGQLQGSLFYVVWVTGEVRRVVLSADGNAVVSDTLVAAGLSNPLDIVMAPDGTLYIAEFGSGNIVYLSPNEEVAVGAVVPQGGPVSGGQAVTITGRNFTQGTIVTFGGQQLVNATVQSSTTITGATPPAPGPGWVDVTVTNSLGSGTLTRGYFYFLPGADSDADGCTDEEEVGPSPTLGGRRDPVNRWDFFDTPTLPGNTRDKSIDVGDISRVVARFGAHDANGTAPINRNSDPLSAPPPPPAYHPAFDRGEPILGGDPWDLAPANGSVSVSDIAGSVRQFGHSCWAPP